MRYKPGQKEQTRERIVHAAGRCFRKGGYGGIGVDGIAKEAGVTSGAFYGHFDSKMEAFAAAITSGMGEVRTLIEKLQQEHGDGWWSQFAHFYMNQKRTCDLAESCAMQSLAPEVGRSEMAIRGVFEDELRQIVQAASRGVAPESDDKAMDRAWATLAMLVGGVTLARAVRDEELSGRIARAIEHAVGVMQEAVRTSGDVAK